MKTYIVTYLVTGVIFLVMDALWLGTMSSLLYRPLLGDRLLDTLDPKPAIAFYLLYVAGIVFFVSMPAFDTGQWTTALLRGAAFGLVAYATYDLTNMATLKGWPAIITGADLAWGTIATSVSATLGYVLVALVLKLEKP